MFEKLEFQGKLWRVCAKVEGQRVDDPNSLRDDYGCDMVIKNNQNIFYILDEIKDVQFEEI